MGGPVTGSGAVPATSAGGGFIYIDPSSLRRSTTRYFSSLYCCFLEFDRVIAHARPISWCRFKCFKLQSSRICINIQYSNDCNE